MKRMWNWTVSFAKQLLFFRLARAYKTGWFSSKLTWDRGESCVDTLGKQREKHTWAWRCGSHVRKELNPALIFPNTDSPGDASLLSFPRLSCRAFSRRVSLYSKPMWWAHVPEGLSNTEVHILCSTYCLGWDDQTRSSGGRGSYPAWRGEGPGSGISQRLLGLCWHPVRLCYQLRLGIRGIFKGNPVLRVWWDSLGSNVEK